MIKDGAKMQRSDEKDKSIDDLLSMGVTSDIKKMMDEPLGTNQNSQQNYPPEFL